MKPHRFSLRARLMIVFRAHVWPRLLWLATPLLLIKRRVRPVRVTVEQLKGKVRGADSHLEILCGITEQTRHHVLELMFETPPASTNLGVVKLLNAFRNLRQLAPKAELAWLPSTASQHAWLDDNTWFSIPQWVQGHISLPLDEKVLRQDSMKTTLRLIRRHGYECVVKRDHKSFEDFYHRMHEPYIRKNFGAGACLDALAEKRADIEEFDLLLVQKKSQPGEYLAGFVIIYEPNAPRLWSLGVRDGDHGLVRDGVLAALYVFCFDFLTGKGFKNVYVGGSRPFLRDGVLNFKRRRSQRLTGFQWEGFSLKVLQLTPGVKHFLLQNPFAFRSRGQLHGAVFATAPVTPEKITALHGDFYHAGFGRMIIWVFPEGETSALPPVPAQLAGQVELRSATELLADNLHLP